MDGDSQHATGKDAFPDRPNHPDFWKLSAIVLGLDAKAERGDSIETLVGPVDWDSLVYMAEQRAARVSPDPEIYRALVSLFIDGFALGCKYGAR